MSSVKIFDQTYNLSRLKDKKNYSRFSEGRRTVKINYSLPFRIKFTNIGIKGYGPNNPPGIGVAVIGFNNYIL